MKPTDKITVEITLGELARIYAVMGNVTAAADCTLWDKAMELLDPEGEVYDAIIDARDDGRTTRTLHYHTYREEWLNALFKQETEQEKRIRELKETITKAQQQIKELENC
jgi:hypothetical protein